MHGLAIAFGAHALILKMHHDSLIYAVLSLSFTDPSLTYTNMIHVLSSVGTERLPYCLLIPPRVLEKIKQKDDRKQRQQFIKYYIYCSPHAISWTFLAGKLHYWKETTAEASVKKFVQDATGVSVACVCDEMFSAILLIMLSLH